MLAYLWNEIDSGYGPFEEKNTLILPIDQTRMLTRLQALSIEDVEEHVLLTAVSTRLLDRLEFILQQPKNILILGVWPDKTVEKLKTIFPQAQFFLLSANLSILKKFKNQVDVICSTNFQLPFQNSCFDFVFSNLSFTMAADLAWIFYEVYSVCKPNALLMMSLFGVDTLQELRYSFSQVDAFAHVHTQIDMHDVGDLLLQLQWQDPVMDMEHLTIHYDVLSDLFLDMKTIAMNNAHQKRCKTLYGKQHWQQMQKIYEQFRNEEGKLPATFEFIYGHAWRGNDNVGMGMQLENETIIP